MLNDVYNRRILELAGGIPRLGRLAEPDASATAHSKLCGSTVTVDLKMDGDTVTDFAHEVKACALGQASSSIMARNVVGAKARRAARSCATPCARCSRKTARRRHGKWADIAVLEPVRDYKARHASTLLTFDAVVRRSTRSSKKRERARKIVSRARAHSVPANGPGPCNRTASLGGPSASAAVLRPACSRARAARRGHELRQICGRAGIADPDHAFGIFGRSPR